MKKQFLLILIAILFSGTTIIAQSGDTTRIKIGSKKILIIEEGEDENVAVEIYSDSLDSDFDIDIEELKSQIEDDDDEESNEFEGHWKGFQLGFNTLIDANNGQPNSEEWISVNSARSWTFGLNLFQYDIPLIKENFGVVSGLGMSWRNFHFDNNIDLQDGSAGVTGVFVPIEEREYTKNRLQGTYLDGMVGLELQLPVGHKDSEFFILGGAYASYRMGSNYMQKWVENDRKQKDKTKDNYQLTDLEYGLTGRIGLGKINLFANYSLTPLFKENKTQNVSGVYYPVTVGLMIVGF